MGRNKKDKKRDNKKKIKNKRKQASQKVMPVLGNIFKQWWADKHPVLLFILGFFGMILLAYAITYSSFYKEGVWPAIVNNTAILASWILNALQENTNVVGHSISSEAFAISLKKGCDAVEGIVLFSAIILAFPTSLKNKLYGLICGITILFLINLLRVVALFLTGVYFPSWFDFMHFEVGQFVFIFFALFCCACWLYWIQSRISTVK